MMGFLLSSKCLMVLFHIDQVRSHPQNSRPNVPHQVDCTVNYRPGGVPADSPPEECLCVPYFRCNSNKTDEGAGVGLTGVGLVSMPPYKACPCAQAISEPKVNNAGVCSNFLDVCCKFQPQIQSDEYPDASPPNNEFPATYPPWQDIPARPWYNSTKHFPWNSSGRPPWNSQNPGGWGFKPNNYPWKDKSWTPRNRNRHWNASRQGLPEKSQTSAGYMEEQRNFCGNGFTKAWRIRNWQDSLPWMVAVFGDKIVDGAIEKKAFLCGGSSVHPGVVLTAAHCVKGKLGLVVGDGRGSEQPVDHVRVHEQYYAGALYNDVALLFLDQPLHPAPEAECLSDAESTIDLEKCVVSSWHAQFGYGDTLESAQKTIDMAVVPRDFCEEKLQTRLGRYFHLHEGFICALGIRDQKACASDGGGPLFCSLMESASYVQVGILSWGVGCEGDVPEVYVNVSYYRHWIELETESLPR